MPQYDAVRLPAVARAAIRNGKLNRSSHVMRGIYKVLCSLQDITTIQSPLYLSRQLSLTHSHTYHSQISISSSVAYTFGTTVGTKWPVRSTVAYVRLPALRMYPSVC